MGGNPGVSGNISPAAEFNFLVDPEVRSAQRGIISARRGFVG
jgi:inosine-uridine nucleoside N-ribohydrolase